MDPFCRWDRINIPYNENQSINHNWSIKFFGALENDVIKYIEENYDDIEKDMNKRNSTLRKNTC